MPSLTSLTLQPVPWPKSPLFCGNAFGQTESHVQSRVSDTAAMFVWPASPGGVLFGRVNMANSVLPTSSGQR